MLRTIVLALLTCAALVSTGGAIANDFEGSLVEAQGEIMEISLADNELVVSGSRYGIDPELRVEIGGSYGAFSLLREGMRISFEYYLYQDGRRNIFNVRELAASEELVEF